MDPFAEPLPHPVDRHVGQRLRIRRRAQGMSQAALAARLGVSFQQVQKYERGTNRLSASALHAAALALETPVADFFAGLDGAAEAAGPDPVAELLGAPGGDALAAAWLALPPGPVRRGFVALARAVAETASPSFRARLAQDIAAINAADAADPWGGLDWSPGA